MAAEVRSSLEELNRVLAEWTPEWDEAQVFPVRYPCSEEEYLAQEYNRLLEYVDGFIEVLPMPTIEHQMIVAFLYDTLKAWVIARRLGIVLFAPLSVRIRAGKFREPDLVFMNAGGARRAGKNYWERPDLVMEVVSERNRLHDLVTKRHEYAEARIPEYWIVAPEEETITVFILGPRRKTYVEHGVFRKGEQAASKVLPGFGVDVTAALTQKV